MKETGQAKYTVHILQSGPEIGQVLSSSATHLLLANDSDKQNIPFNTNDQYVSLPVFLLRLGICQIFA